MGYKIGTDRKQLTLLPVSLDDYISEYHICRLIYAFTEQLDMWTLGFKYGECKSTGCRPYDPRMMLNLYIYGYLHRVRSSRRLRDEAVRNVEVMWLLEGLTPDDRTICNFRKDNAKILKDTFRVFSRMNNELDLYSGELLATDSVKIRANNSLVNNHNKTTVNNALARIDKKIDEYLNTLEQMDMQEDKEEDHPDSSKIKAALEKIKTRKVKYEDLKARLEEESEVSTVDPESRLMRTGGEGRKLDVNYNIQTVVDSKYHLVVDFEVSNCASDAGNLKGLSDSAKEIMNVEEITNLADSGYYSGADITACEESGTRCLVAKPAASGHKKAEGFNRDDFIYDSEKDVYKCPCQKELNYKRNGKYKNGMEFRVYSNYPACKNCEKKAECTTARYRERARLGCQDTLDVVDKRTKNHKELYKKRQEIVEHCFGTIKSVWGYRQFLCRKIIKVTAEMSLTYIAYNLRRIFNIFAENRKELAMELG